MLLRISLRFSHDAYFRFLYNDNNNFKNRLYATEYAYLGSFEGCGFAVCIVSLRFRECSANEVFERTSLFILTFKSCILFIFMPNNKTFSLSY